MAGAETVAGGLQRWPNIDTGDIAGSTRAAFGISLAIFMLAMESERLSALVHVSGFHVKPGLMLISFAILGCFAAWRCFHPVRRLAHPAIIFACAVVCSYGLFGIYFFENSGIPEVLRAVGTLAGSITPALLVYCWVERAMPFGRMFVMQGFGIGAIGLGCLSILTMALARPAAIVLVVALPIVGAAVLVAASSGKGAYGGSGTAALRAGSNPYLAGGQPATEERWNAIRAIAETRRGLRGHPLMKLVPFVCYAVIFGNVHASWVALQDGPSIGIWVQAGAAIGTLACGAAAIGLQRMHWGHAFESILHLFLAAIALVALWLSTFLTSGFTSTYLVLLNIAQKLSFLLMLMFGFPFARNWRECTSLWVLAYFSFYVGMVLSAIVGAAQSAGFANAFAAIALAVLLVADLTEIVLIYGLKPLDDAQDGSNVTVDDDASYSGAEATLIHEPNRPVGTPIASESEQPLASPEKPVGIPGFDPAAYTCHLIADQHGLTRREEDVLQLIVRGRDAARISESLGISLATTRTHFRNIYAKLHVHSQQDILDLFERYSGE